MALQKQWAESGQKMYPTTQYCVCVWGGGGGGGGSGDRREGRSVHACVDVKHRVFHPSQGFPSITCR